MKRNVLIIGAGQAGQMVLNLLLQKHVYGRVVGFLDDDSNKYNLKIKGVKVIGSIEKIENVLITENIDQIVIAMPSIEGKTIRKIYEKCKKTNVEIFTLPSIHSIISGKITTNSIRKIRLEDLLHRNPIKTNLSEVSILLEKKVVFVSGAGGSIGSELVRQIINFNPKRLFSWVMVKTQYLNLSKNLRIHLFIKII